MTRKGSETSKTCGRCRTVWLDSWLDDNADKNECPFCGYVFDFRTAERVRLPKIKRKNIHWKQESSIKLMSRISSDITEIDWKVFNNPNYYKLLKKRENIIRRLNQELEKFFDREVHKNKKPDTNVMRGDKNGEDSGRMG